MWVIVWVVGAGATSLPDALVGLGSGGGIKISAASSWEASASDIFVSVLNCKRSANSTTEAISQP